MGGSKKGFELTTSGTKIGRAPKGELVLKQSGISWHHLELKVLPPQDGLSARLGIRDLSTNGTGVKAPGTSAAVRLQKDTDTLLLSGSVVVLPMKIKAAEGAPADLRASFGIYIGEVVPENAALEVRTAIPGLESEGKIAAAPDADVPAPAKGVKEKKGTLPTPPPPSEPAPTKPSVAPPPPPAAKKEEDSGKDGKDKDAKKKKKDKDKDDEDGKDKKKEKDKEKEKERE